MNKSALVTALSEKSGLSRAKAQEAVEALFGTENGIIAAALKGGERVSIPGFGSFESRKREGRTGRNPRTGKEMKIGPSTSAGFRAGKNLKDSLGA